jgi:serine/threonine-protein kinase
MGEVYQARHLAVGRTVAVKVLDARHAGNEQMRTRFINEARAVAQIHHPSVVALYDFGVAGDGQLYLVMELLDGEPLSARLKRSRRLPESDALRIGRQLAGGLRAAHEAGILHRDLKPSNVILVPDPESDGGERAKLVDFGVAKWVDDDSGDPSLTQTGSIVGTPTFMSPEQCSGTGQIDARSDVYALGLLLYCMVAGRPPFIGKGTGEIIGMHLYVQPESPRVHVPELSPTLEHCILTCLEKDPSARYGSMAELLEELCLLSGRPADASVPPRRLSSIRPAVSLPLPAPPPASVPSPLLTQPPTQASPRPRSQPSSAPPPPVLPPTQALLPSQAASPTVALPGPAVPEVGPTRTERLTPGWRSVWLAVACAIAAIVGVAAVRLAMYHGDREAGIAAPATSTDPPPAAVAPPLGTAVAAVPAGAPQHVPTAASVPSSAPPPVPPAPVTHEPAGKGSAVRASPARVSRRARRSAVAAPRPVESGAAEAVPGRDEFEKPVF